jgi:probable HAF family extracellular repeat protein
MRKPSHKPVRYACSLLALLTATDAWACGQGGSPAITNLPSLGGSFYEATALNASGQVAGFSTTAGDVAEHAFLYIGGSTVDLGTLGGDSSEGYAMNNQGQVVGKSTDINGDTHAVLFSNGSLTDLGDLGGGSSEAHGINNAGLIIGESIASSDESHAFLYSAGSMIDLGTLGQFFSSAAGINSSGTVVGDSENLGFANDGYFYANGLMTDLGDLGGGYSSARAINDSGLIVGEAAIPSGDTHAFSFSSGVMSDLGTLGGHFSSASTVNTNGQIIGTSSTVAGESFVHGFIYKNHALVDLGTLGGNASNPQGLNNLGQVVGDSTLPGGASHAFIWQTNSMVDLNTYLPANSGWELTSAQFINDAGRIVGVGFLNGNQQVFVLDLSSGNGGGAPPVAVAGPDQTVACSVPATLDAGASTGESLAYQWTEAANILGTNATLTASFGLGAHTITLTVTDACGGSASTNVVLTVVDNTAPSISSPAPVVAFADSNCQAPVPDFLSGANVSDNCSAPGQLVLSQNPAPGTLLSVGQYPVTLTVIDVAGNHSTSSTTFTVKDATKPVIVSLPAPVVVSSDANCSGTVPNLVAGVVAADNCTPANALVITQNPAAGTQVGVGQYSVTITVTDASGNSASGSTSFTVKDTAAPVIVSIPGPITVSSGANCGGAIPNVVSSVVAADNCTPANQLVITQSPAAGTPVADGQYTIVVTVKDASGNSTTGNVAVTVADNAAPVVQSIGATPNILWPPNNKILNVKVAVGAVDNCDSAPVSKIISITSNQKVDADDIQITGNLTANLEASRDPDIGARIYTITVRTTDASGNSTTATTTVTCPKSQ